MKGPYLLPENWLSLTSVALLFTIISSSALGSSPFLRLLVLRYLVQLMVLALFAECLPLLWDVNLILWRNVHLEIVEGKP
jgi:hypothetical protein